MRSFFLILFIQCGFATFIFAQEKFENEKRIEASKVPPSALTFISEIDFENKIKWYEENSQDGTSYEAKSKWNSYKYSIEFDENGQCLDAEKTIKWKRLNADLRKSILASLSNTFSKIKVSKFQLQLNCKQFMEEEIKGVELIQSENVFYELVIKAIKESNRKFYEVLMNQKGEMIKTLEIIDRPMDNIEF